MAFFKKKINENEPKNRAEEYNAVVDLTQVKTGILLHPHITEKTSVAAGRGTYVFSVGRNANKIEIKKAIQRKYNVAVTDVRVVNIHGKEMRRGAQIGWRGRMKKAYATLAEGQRIEMQ